jgi:heptosyltransferase-1
MPVSLPEMGSDASPPRRILIIRLSAIGDVVFASPLVDAVAQRYPNAEVFWLAEPMVLPLLEHHAHLSGVIVWPRSEWRQLFRTFRWWGLFKAVRAFRRQLRAHRFDLVFDVQGLLKSAFLAWLTGARHRVGFRSKEPTSVFLTERLEKDTGPTISSEYRAFAAQLGLPADAFRMRVPLSQEVSDWARAFQGDSPYIVFCPFTTRPQKHWVEAHWRQLAERAVEAGLRVVVVGAPSDVPASERIFEDVAIESMVGQCSLSHSAALVSYADALIGVDTGLTHMGWAFEVPTLALFGSTCPYRDVGGLEGAVLYHELDCSPCRRKPTCGGAYHCMHRITPDAVFSAGQRYFSTVSRLEPVIASSAIEGEPV